MRRIDTMGFTKSLFRLAGVAVLVMLISSCLTDRMPLHVQDRPIKTDTYEDLTATVRFVDEAILKAKYKEEVNPFLTDYNKMQLRRVIVFELTVENEGSEALLFILNRLELQYGGKALQPYNRFQLGQHWEFTDEDEGTMPIHKVRREKIIEETVLANSYTLQAGGIMQGYVVFVGNTPNYGSAKIHIPLFESKDKVYHRFEFPFEF
jgi:hypothetical protein